MAEVLLLESRLGGGLLLKDVAGDGILETRVEAIELGLVLNGRLETRLHLHGVLKDVLRVVGRKLIIHSRGFSVINCFEVLAQFNNYKCCGSSILNSARFYSLILL